MDGFITRRPQRSSLGDRPIQKTDTTIGHMRTDERRNVEVHTGEGDEELVMKSGHRTGENSLQQNINESLQAIEKDSVEKKAEQKKGKKKRRRTKIVSLVIGLILLLGVGFLLYKAWQVGSRIFQGNFFGIFQQQELKKDAHGRSNVLILGSTDDMPGRDGADLTDSMMVLSVSQEKKDAYMFSIPRDLWVDYGRACFSGYSGKINAFYACADDGKGKEAELRRMEATRKLVGKIFDMDIQYAVHVNTVVIRDSVNAVGGITVNVESEDPRGVLDSTFDDICWQAGQDRQKVCPSGHYLDLKKGPNNLDGQKAMAFSQARGMGAISYGLSKSNFDREKNQQLVLMALKDKAASSGTLTDIGKIMGLMDAMGNNLRTNIDASEVRTIADLATKIDSGNIKRLSFVDGEPPLMTIGNAGGQSIVQPVAGLTEYGQIRAFIKKNIYATPVSREDAKVLVLNGGGPAGSAQAEVDKLRDLGMNMLAAGNAPEGDYGKFKLYQLVSEDKKTATRAKLEELYGTKVAYSQPPFSLSQDADFVVVVGPSQG